MFIPKNFNLIWVLQTSRYYKIIPNSVNCINKYFNFFILSIVWFLLFIFYIAYYNYNVASFILIYFFKSPLINSFKDFICFINIGLLFSLNLYYFFFNFVCTKKINELINNKKHIDLEEFLSLKILRSYYRLFSCISLLNCLLFPSIFIILNILEI